MNGDGGEEPARVRDEWGRSRRATAGAAPEDERDDELEARAARIHEVRTLRDAARRRRRERLDELDAVRDARRARDERVERGGAADSGGAREAALEQDAELFLSAERFLDGERRRELDALRDAERRWAREDLRAPPRDRAAPEEPERRSGARGRERDGRLVAGGAVQGLGGAGAVALAVFGISGVLPAWLAEIGAVTAGAAVLAGGAVLRGRLARSRAAATAIAMSALCGAAAIPLGILALAGIAPWPLASVAVLALGIALLLAAPIPARAIPGERGTLARASRDLATAFQALAGLAAATLGALALAAIAPLWLVLFAVLAAGAALLLTGVATAVSGALAPPRRER